MLHVTSGDAAAEPLRAAALPGEIVTVIDPLHEGPALAGGSPDEWRTLRARFAAESGWAPFEDALARYAESDAALDSLGDHDEVVLWFEHDLHCQLALVRLLARLARVDRARLSLICIGEFPGIDPFRGLGQLDGGQMAVLFSRRVAVSRAALDLAAAAWNAFCSPDPLALEAMVRGDTSALPFLGAALGRHLEQFPSVGDGLSRTERQILDVVASRVTDRREIFRRAQSMEAVPFMTDMIFDGHLDRMTRGERPLLFARGPGQVDLTATGRDVRAAGRDWIALNGIDRWLGGVHLTRDHCWRWDERARRLRGPRG